MAGPPDQGRLYVESGLEARGLYEPRRLWRMAVEFLCSCCQAAPVGAASAGLGQTLEEETGMAMQLGHVLG